MFVGHYGVAFAVRSERNQIPLWVLFVAVQLLDFLWAPFVLLGIEKVRMVPGITATNSLDLYYMPYTHSLVGTLIWSGAAFPYLQTRARREDFKHSGIDRRFCCLFSLDPGFDCSPSRSCHLR